MNSRIWIHIWIHMITYMYTWFMNSSWYINSAEPRFQMDTILRPSVPRRFKCSPAVNVNRHKPCHSCAARHTPGARATWPRPGPALGTAESPAVEQLLKRKTRTTSIGHGTLAARPPFRQRLLGAGGPPRLTPGAGRGVRLRRPPLGALLRPSGGGRPGQLPPKRLRYRKFWRDWVNNHELIITC